MYKKHEIVQLKKEFWTRLGLYMAPVPSASGDTINWINYKTGVKDLFFRFDASPEGISVSIELHHRDASLREELYTKLKAFRQSLDERSDQLWEWKFAVEDEQGKIYSSATVVKEGVSILNRNDWPAMISFFKPQMIALDEWWTEIRDFFID